MVSRTRPRL